MNNANISIVADNSKAINQVDALTKAWNELNNTSEQSRKNLSQFNETAEGLNKSWIEINQGIYSAIGNIKELGNSIKSAFSYLREGADLAEAEMNFKAYTTSIGQSADDLMAKFRKATRNQVSDVELMKSATKALRVSGIKDIDALSKLYEIADTKGDLLGLSLQETFDKIVSAISSSNGRALIQLGVLPESFSRASNSADLLKNKALLLKEVIKDSQADFKSLANVGETASDKFNQIEAAVSNLSREFKIQLADAAMPLIDFAKNEGIPIAKSVIEFLNDTIKAIGKVAKEFEYFDETVKFLGASFVSLGIGSVLTNFTKLATAIKSAASAQVVFNTAALTNPYILAGSAIAGLTSYGIYNSLQIHNANETAFKNYKALQEQNTKTSMARLKLATLEEAGNRFVYNQDLDKELQKRNSQIYELENRRINKNEPWAPAILPSDVKASISFLQEEIKQIEEAKNAQDELNEAIKEYQSIIKDKQEKEPYATQTLEIEAESLEIDEERAKLADQLINKYGNLAKTYKPLISNEKEAYEIALAFTKAAGGLTPCIENGITAFGKLAEEAQKVKSISEDINNVFMGGGTNELLKAEKAFKSKSTGEQIYGMWNYFSGGLLNKKGKDKTENAIEDLSENMYKDFSSATANAITDGLLNADFSGFRQNLGSILKGTVSNYLSDTFNSVLSGSNTGVLQNATNSIFKQVYTKNSKGGSSLNFGNLLTNVGIGLGVSWLTGEGGLFGKRKIKGAENIDKSNSLNAQVDNAKAIRDELLTAVGITEATRQALENAIFSYTWTTSHKNHNPFHRTKTYYLHGQEEAQASIDYLEKLQQLSQSEQANRNYQLWDLSRGDTIGSANLSYLDTLSAYEYMATAKNYNSTQLSQTLYKQKTAQQTIRNIQSQLANAEKARNDYYQKLVEQYTTKTYDRRTRSYTTSVNTKAIDRAMAQYDSQGIYSYQIKQLQNQLTQAQNNLATITAEYNKGNSNKYSEAEIAEAKLAAEEAKQALLTAQQSERTTFTSNFLNNSTLAGLYGNNASVISKLLGNDYSKFDTTSSIQQMLPMLEAAGLKDYDWQKRLSEAGTDTQKQIAVYQEQQSILESALKTYESIMKDNKEEALNTRLSVEEQQSAFERWQEAFNQVLAIQQEIADNTNTIAELEKSKYADTLADQLSDVMTVVAEAVRQTNGKETVIYYQNATGKEILAKFKAAIQNGNVKNADDLLTAINETEQLEIWG